MKIFDCFMYFDEEVVLDLRLNILNEYVDYFVIVESIFTHKGEQRKLQFNHEKFAKFKNKIIYLKYDLEHKNIEKISPNDNEEVKSRKYILNAGLRENDQRNFIINGIKEAQNEDMVLISDVDEIPNLQMINIKSIKNKLILFEQNIFYYKLNRFLPGFKWYGTKACKKKHLKSPQWLRNIKGKSYPKWRLDTYFSKKNIQIYILLKMVDGISVVLEHLRISKKS